MMPADQPSTHIAYLCRKVGTTFEWLDCGNGYVDANGDQRARIDRLPLGDEVTGDGWTGHIQIVPRGGQPKQVDPDTL